MVDSVSEFHRAFYGQPATTWANTRWLGHLAQKCPLDLWVYQEILFELSPGLIIETGTNAGGSALFLASILDMLYYGHVVTIDMVAVPDRPRHERIQYVEGSSIDPAIVADVSLRASAASPKPVVVILDSDHRKDHVLAEMHAYADMVTPGSYLLVEDTNLNGHPVAPGFGPGPAEAVVEFLAQRSDFVRDPLREKYMMTFNPGGYLRRMQ